MTIRLDLRGLPGSAEYHETDLKTSEVYCEEAYIDEMLPGSTFEPGSIVERTKGG